MADEDMDMNEAEENEEEILEGDEEGGEDYDEEGEEGNKNLLLIIGGVFVLLIGVAAGLYFTGMLDGVLGKGGDHAESAEHADAGDHGGGGKDGDGHGGKAANFLEIPTILVNLSSNDGTPRYLRLTVQLELHSSADYGAVEAVIPRVVDQFQTYLRELRVKDLRGSAGIYRLQMELLWRVNQAAAPVKVKDVLFQEILIQ